MLRLRYSLEMGKLLKHVRLLAGKTQVGVAEDIGFNTSTNISGYEHGKRIPDLSTIILILRECGYQLAIVPLEEERELYCDDGCLDWDEHREHDRRANPCGLHWHDHCEHTWR
jgi:transcriptional regulator with XRE-family HTH domain